MNKETIQDVSTCPDEKELTLQYLRSMQDDYIEGEGYERHPLPEWYALEYAINVLEQEPCDDCVNRKAVHILIHELEEALVYEKNYISRERDTTTIIEDMLALPTVTPQPKIGHWIYTPKRRLVDDEEGRYITDYRCSCSKCGGDFGFQKMNDAFCKYCGAMMVESQESEE